MYGTGRGIKDGNKTYEYRVVEAASKNGPFSDSTVTTSDGCRYTLAQTPNDNAITLTNTRQPAKYALAILKQDAEDNHALGGAEFLLEKLETDSQTYKQVGDTVTRQSDGKCSFDNLAPGSYRLTETKAPDGYNLLADSILFTLDDKGQCTINAAPFDQVDYDAANGVYTVNLTINNRKQFTLPHTGADAPSLWLLIGLPVLAAGLLIFAFCYNKKGGKRS